MALSEAEGVKKRVEYGMAEDSDRGWMDGMDRADGDTRDF